MEKPTDRLKTRESVKHLKERYGVRTSEGHLIALRRLGRGPAYIRIGRTIVYVREDLDRWVAARTVRVEPELA